MNNEHLEEIKNIIKNSNYKNHYKLQDYFEVEYIDELVQYVEQLENIRKEAIEKVKEMRKNFKQYEHIGTAYDDDLYYEDLLNILNKGRDKE